MLSAKHFFVLNKSDNLEVILSYYESKSNVPQSLNFKTLQLMKNENYEFFSTCGNTSNREFHWNYVQSRRKLICLELISDDVENIQGCYNVKIGLFKLNSNYSSINLYLVIYQIGITSTKNLKDLKPNKSKSQASKNLFWL